MNVVLDLVAHARFAEESQIDQAEHVERRHQRGGVADEPQDAICAAFRVHVCQRISSLEKKPANGGMPAIASVATSMVR